MQAELSNIINCLETLAPKNLAEIGDNVGFLIGERNSKIKNILVALDITTEVINEAIDLKADLIISHHPFIYNKINNITTETPLGNRIIKCIKNNISIYSAHTNLDVVDGGTNDLLFEKLHLINKEGLLQTETGNFFGRTGELEKEITFEEFCNLVKNKLNLQSIRYVGDLNKKVKRIGLCTGSAANMDFFLECINKECQVYLTSDIKHHDALSALDLNLLLVDGTHYGTEFLMIDFIKDKLNMFLKENNFKSVAFSTKVNTSVFYNL